MVETLTIVARQLLALAKRNVSENETMRKLIFKIQTLKNTHSQKKYIKPERHELSFGDFWGIQKCVDFDFVWLAYILALSLSPNQKETDSAQI